MTNTSQLNDNYLDNVVGLVLNLITSFRGNRKMEFGDIGSLYFMGEDHPNLKTEGKIVWQILDGIHRKNPQVSTREIFSSLISEIVGQVVIDPYTPISDKSYEEIARDKIRMLIKYSASRDTDIPLAGIRISKSPLMFGNVTFHPITQGDREGEWWEKIEHTYFGNPNIDIVSYGRTNSSGDWEIAIDSAERVLQETLLVIRAIGFPLDEVDPSQFGIINEFSLWANQPIRLGKPEETVRIDGTSKVVTRVGRPIKTYDLKIDLLSNVDEETLKLIDNLLKTESDSDRSKMDHKLLNGLRWIGESTKPDTLPAKYLKLATALEFLIGGESSDEFLATRGITATLAERAAFFLGNFEESRLDIDREIRGYYGKRSKIVHGEKGKILHEDYYKFGSLVRQISFALCNRLSDLKTIDDFQRWVNSMKYS